MDDAFAAKTLAAHSVDSGASAAEYQCQVRGVTLAAGARLQAGAREQLQIFFELEPGEARRKTIAPLQTGQDGAAGVMVTGLMMVTVLCTPVGMPAVSLSISRSVGPSIS